jgi:outer membrane protein assembly factor BamB
MVGRAKWSRSLVRGAVVVPLLVVLAGCNEWTMFRFGPDHTGFNAAEATLQHPISVSNVGTLVLKGTATTNAPVESSPVIATISNVSWGFVISKGQVGTLPGTLYAYDASGTGSSCSGSPKVCSPLWTANAGQNGRADFDSSPAVVNGVVYAVTNFGELYAFDAAGVTNCTTVAGSKTCQPLWTSALLGGSISAAPTVATISTSSGPESYVYVSTVYGHLYVFDAGTGTSDNCQPSSDPGTPPVCDWEWGANTPGDVYASAAVANGVVYTASGTSGQTLWAFDAAGNCGTVSHRTCNPLWKASWPGGKSSPAVANGVVYIGANDGNLYAFDAAGVTNCSPGTPTTCAPLWTASTGNQAGASPAVANGMVYIGANNGTFDAFDATGSTNCTAGPPKTCAPLWTASTGSTIKSSASIANGVVFVGSEDSKVYAFDAAGSVNCSGILRTCTPLWTGTTGGPVDSSPSVANATVYVGSNDKSVYAYGLP